VASKKSASASEPKKPGRKPRPKYSPKQLLAGVLGLQNEIESAVRTAKSGTAPPTSAALDAAVYAYLGQTDPHRQAISHLAYAAVRLALGHDVDHVIQFMSTGLIAYGQNFGFQLKRTHALNAAIERKHATPLLKAHHILLQLAKSAGLEVAQDKVPRGDVKRVLEDRICQLTHCGQCGRLESVGMHRERVKSGKCRAAGCDAALFLRCEIAGVEVGYCCVGGAHDWRAPVDAE